MMSDNTIILIRILGGRVMLAENRQPLFTISLLGSRIMQKVAAITAGGSGMGAAAAPPTGRRRIPGRHPVVVRQRQGTGMNNILPGFINSLPGKAEFRARIPMGRYGDVSEIAGAVSFLASDATAYITGQTLRVDGGITRSV